MIKNWIGIDLGIGGAIVVVNDKSETILQMTTPLIKNTINWLEINNILKKFDPTETIVVFEKIGVIFGSSKKTAFAMGGHYQGMINLCIANGIRYETIPPKTWQAEIFGTQDKIYKTGKKSIDTKAMALSAFQRLFPNRDMIIGVKNGKPNDGFIDAALIAEYGYRKFLR